MTKAKRQLFIVTAVLLIAASAAALWMNAVSKKENSLFLHHDGLVYEAVTNERELALFSLSSPLSASDCGEKITTNEDASRRLYRLNHADTRALLIAEEGEGASTRYTLYRFCYLDKTSGAADTMADALAICGDNTRLQQITYYTKDERSTLEDEASLSRCLSLLESAPLQPLTAEQSQTLQSSGSWSGFLELAYENGVLYRLFIYDELNVISCFRHTYTLPQELKPLF